MFVGSLFSLKISINFEICHLIIPFGSFFYNQFCHIYDTFKVQILVQNSLFIWGLISYNFMESVIQFFVYNLLHFSLILLKSVPFGRYLLISPLVFSLVPLSKVRIKDEQSIFLYTNSFAICT